uniref:Small ribosomal subunit protein uS14m n=1 Tax=Opuntia streptacantha TaxID=393608 RepID=A0A7C8ZGP7_OPUST
MFRVFGKLLGKVSVPPAAPRTGFLFPSPVGLQSIRGFSSGVSSYVAEKRNILDYKRRLLVAKYELRRKLYKSLCRDLDLPSNLREKHRYKLSKLPRNSSSTRIRNRCIFTGRPRAVYENFRMSRIVFRELASQGRLHGIKKASW